MDYTAQVRALQHRGQNAAPQVGKATTPKAGEFNDEILLALNEKDLLPDYLLSLGMYKKIFSRFWTLYFTGTVRAGDNVAAVVYDTAFLGKIGGKKIWDQDAWYGKEGFYTPNKSTEEILASTPSGAQPEISFTNENLDASKKDEFLNFFSSYSGDTFMKMRESISKTIEDFDPTQELTEEMEKLIGVSSFLALVLLRFATRDARQMANATLKKQLRTNLISLAGWDAEKPFGPPCKQCLEICALALAKGSAWTSKAFTKIVARFIWTQHPDYADPQVAGFLAATVLTHTARNGIGLIQMEDAVETITSLSWLQLMEYTYWNVTVQTWEAITHFFETQLDLSKPQFGYNWARIINDGFLRGLSPRDHPFLATVFAAVIEKVQGPTVWSAIWARDITGYDAAKALGYELYNETRPSISTLVGFDKANKLAEKVQKRKTDHIRSQGLSDAAKSAAW